MDKIEALKVLGFKYITKEKYFNEPKYHDNYYAAWKFMPTKHVTIPTFNWDDYLKEDSALKVRLEAAGKAKGTLPENCDAEYDYIHPLGFGESHEVFLLDDEDQKGSSICYESWSHSNKNFRFSDVLHLEPGFADLDTRDWSVGLIVL